MRKVSGRDGDAGAAAVAARPPQGPNHGECKLLGGGRRKMTKTGAKEENKAEKRRESEREHQSSLLDRLKVFALGLFSS